MSHKWDLCKISQRFFKIFWQSPQECNPDHRFPKAFLHAYPTPFFLHSLLWNAVSSYKGGISPPLRVRFLLLLDASHFVMGCDFLGSIYGIVRRFVRTFSGRKRCSVLGAIDYATKNILTVTNDSDITAKGIQEMLRKISTTYAGKAVPESVKLKRKPFSISSFLCS